MKKIIIPILILTLLMTCAFAEKSITLGKDAIDGYNTSSNSYEYVYFGTYNGSPIKWRVLDTTSNDGSTPAVFMLSEYTLGNKAFRSDWEASDANQWATSDIKTYLQGEFTDSSFDLAEKEAIIATTKTNDTEAITDFGVYLGATNLDNEKLFLLSASEAVNTKYGFSSQSDGYENRNAYMVSAPTGSAVSWWLRSLAKSYTREVGYVDSFGSWVSAAYVDGNCELRPALNLNPASILFTSNADVKSSTDLGMVRLTEVTSTEHKLTLVDSDSTFSIDETKALSIPGGTISINYGGATIGEKEYISAIIVDENSIPIYYGKIQKLTTESGTMNLVLPADIEEGKYTLKIFSEQCNEGYNTDYASSFNDVALTIVKKPTIALGKEAIDGYNADADGYQYIYFGTYNGEPIKWRVLDTTSNDGSTPAVFMLSEYTLGYHVFRSDWQASDANQWATSDIKTYLQGEFTDSSFDLVEKDAIIATTKTNDTAATDYYGNTLGATNLDNEKLFLLSGSEAVNTKYGFSSESGDDENRKARSISAPSGSGVSWWLRSPISDRTNLAGYVYWDGWVNLHGVDDDIGLRPALNLNPASILFTSPAVGNGETLGITKITEKGYLEHKATLLDANRKFVVDDTDISTRQGKTISVAYNGATVGANEYVSAIIVDENNVPLYYGRIVKAEKEYGRVNITIPEDLAAGEYTLKLFSQKCNGDYKSDYASAFKDIKLTVVSSVFPERAISFGSSAINGYNQDTNSYEYVYFGKFNGNPIKWRVLDTTSNDGSTPALFMLSEYTLKNTSFRSGWMAGMSEGNANHWSASDIKTYLQGEFIENFTILENEAILPTTTTNDIEIDGFGIAQLDKEKIFLLSVNEALNTKYGFSNDPNLEDENREARKVTSPTGAHDGWWLRSPSSGLSPFVGIISYWTPGEISSDYADGDPLYHGVRPALNIDPESILFTSSTDIKQRLASNTGRLLSVSQTAPTEHKITLLDPDREFTVDTTPIIIPSDVMIRINYNGAEIGDNEYISAIVLDENNVPIYYGSVIKPTSTSGTEWIGHDLVEGNYTLRVFSEQYNGENAVDYASAFQDIKLKIVGACVAFEGYYYDSIKPESVVLEAGSRIILSDLTSEGKKFLGWNYENGYTPSLLDFLEPSWEDAAAVETIPDIPDTSGANAPELYQGLKPIKYTANGGVVFTTAYDPEWYNYSTGKWANAVTVDEENNITGYYVWIPRYAYLIRTGYNSADTGRIDIRFLSGTTNKDQNGKAYYTIDNLENTAEKWKGPNNVTYVGDRQMEYLVHPAFRFGEELSGIWVAKYEAGKTIDGELVSIPYVALYNNSHIVNSFVTAAENNAHLIKPTEYGAVVYLEESIYAPQAQYEVKGLDEIEEYTSGYLDGIKNKYNDVYVKAENDKIIDVKGSAYLETSDGTTTWYGESITPITNMMIKGSRFGTLTGDGKPSSAGFRVVLKSE